MARDDVLRIGLGSAQFGMQYGITNAKGRTPKHEVELVLRTAERNGINTIDTAFAYGDSELVLGKNDLSHFKIVSKFSENQLSSTVPYCLEQSLGRLDTTSLYAYIAHGAGSLLKNPEIWEQCLALKQGGKIRKTGYSIYSTEELDRLLSKAYFPDLIQVPYSLVDRRFEAYFGELKQGGTEIHVRSCFLQGLLFSSPEQLSDFFKPIFPFLQEFHETFNTTEEQASALIEFCMQNSNVDKVIIGVNDSEQLHKNLSMIKKDLSRPAKDPPVPDLPDHILLPYKWPAV